MPDRVKSATAHTTAKLSPPGSAWVPAGTFLLLFFLAGLYLLRLDHAPPYVNDELYFFSLAKYILAGYGYIDACFPGSPSHHTFSVFDPFFTAGLIKIFGDNYFLLRAIHLLTGFAALVPIYLLFKTICGQRKAVGIVLMTAASSGVFPGVGEIRSDLPYLLFSFAFLLWAEKLRRGNQCPTSSFTFGALFLALSCLSRQIAATLLLVLPAIFLLRMPKDPVCRKKTALFIFLSILAFGTYSLLSKAGLNYVGYFQFPRTGTEYFSSAFSLGLIKNVYAILFYGFPSVLSGFTFESRNYLALSVSLLVFAGFIIKIRHERTVLDLYFLIYSLVILRYPATEQVAIRYLIPLAPAAFYYLLSAIEVTILPFRQRPAPLIAALLLSAELAVTLAHPSSQAGTNKARMAEGTELMTEWVKTNTPENTLFLSNNPQALHIYAARKSVKSSFLFPTPELTNAETALKWMNNNRVDYIVTDGFWERTQMEFYPAIGACPSCFRKIYDKSAFSIYKINKAVLNKRIAAGPSKGNL